MTKTIHSEGHDALCAELVRVRRAAGLTQSDLAARLKCHQSMVARIESGQRRIDVVELIVLARALQADPAEIVSCVDAATDAGHRL